MCFGSRTVAFINRVEDIAKEMNDYSPEFVEGNQLINDSGGIAVDSSSASSSSSPRDPILVNFPIHSYFIGGSAMLSQLLQCQFIFWNIFTINDTWH